MPLFHAASIIMPHVYSQHKKSSHKTVFRKTSYDTTESPKKPEISTSYHCYERDMRQGEGYSSVDDSHFDISPAKVSYLSGTL